MKVDRGGWLALLAAAAFIALAAFVALRGLALLGDFGDEGVPWWAPILTLTVAGGLIGFFIWLRRN